MKILVKQYKNGSGEFYVEKEYIGGYVPSSLIGREEGKPYSARSASGDHLQSCYTVMECREVVFEHWKARKG